MEPSLSRRDLLRSSAALLSGGAFIDATVPAAGAQDESRIELENESVTVASDPSDLASRNYLTAFATDERTITHLPHEFSAYTPEGDRLGHRNTEEHTRLRGSGWEAISTRRTFAFDERSAVSLTHQLNLPPENPIVIIKTEFENESESEITIDRPETHITEGVMLTRTPPLYSPRGTYRYYVDGHSVEAFDDSDLWLPYEMDGSRRFITHFGSEAAITTSYLDGRTEPIMGKTRTTEDVDDESELPHSEENPPARQTVGFDVDCLDFCVDGFTLEPGESAEYAVAVSTHDGGENAVANARERTETAETLWNDMPDLTHSTVQPDSEGAFPSVGQVSQPAMIVAGGGVVGAAMYAWRRSRQSDDGTPTGTATTDTDAEAHSTTGSSAGDPGEDTDRLRERATELLAQAEEAEADGEYRRAANAYEEAIARFEQAAAGVDDDEAGEDLEVDIGEAQASLDSVTAIIEARESVTTTLQTAERSFKEAIAQYVTGSRTVARIRFRQARDAFEDAQQAASGSEAPVFTRPIEVRSEEGATLPSMVIEDLAVLEESTAETLAAVGIESITDLEAEDGALTPAVVSDLRQGDTIPDENETPLTLLSWWYEGDSREFASETAISRRYEQADYGFNQTT